MKKIKQYKYIIITVSALILLGGAFYWFQIRPAQIRSKCMNLAQQGKQKEGYSGLANLGLNPNNTKINELYSNCIKLKGLDK